MTPTMAAASARATLLLLLAAASFFGVGCRGALDEDQKEATRAAFQQLLKLQPPQTTSSQQHHHQQPVKPPRHMLELYNKYRQHGGPGGTKKAAAGNTVRSILPTVKDSEMLMFNMTCIGRAEEVHLAQLHLHRRRLRRTSTPSHRRRLLAPPCKVKLYRVISNPKKHRSRTAPLASLPVPESIRGGWHSLDITPVLRELLLASSATAVVQLGVRFEAPRGRTIPADEFLHPDNNDTAAFVVVFSEDFLDNAVEARMPEEVKQALSSVKGDDLYLVDEDEDATDPPPTPTDEPDSDYNDFSFEEVKVSRNGKSKKKKKSGKNVAKSILDSLNEDIKLPLKPKQDLPLRGNDLDEDSSEGNNGNHLTDEVVKKRPAEKVWPTKKEDENAKDYEKTNDIFRRRRMHPKSRYRVKMWKDYGLYGDSKGKKDGSADGRSMKYSEETASKEKKSKGVDEDGDDEEGDKREKRDVDWEVGEGTSGWLTERGRRSIHDNELPDTEVEGGKDTTWSAPAHRALDNRLTQEAYRNTESLIPYPTPSNRRWRGEAKRRRGRGRKRENRKKGKKGKKGADHWQHSPEHNNSSRTGDTHICHRKKLQVDFAEIGWSDWIISPPQFEAYYCSGRCSYPLSTVVKPTNHATVQSLIYAVGHQPEVPEPCCVPDKLSPTALLYLDENRNVVLRQYVDMSVESCACR